MPIYEYRCESCGFQKEYIQRMSDTVLTDCPECHKPTFNKMVTAAGFQLKGGGWYVTDFKGGGSASTAPKKTDGKQTDKSAKPDGSGNAATSASDTSSASSSTTSSAASASTSPGSST